VPSTVRSSNVLCQHLECNISVYFAVFPIRTGVCLQREEGGLAEKSKGKKGGG